MVQELLQRALRNPLVSLALLFGPSVVAVTQANTLANHLFEPLTSLLGYSLEWLAKLPSPIAEIKL